MSPSSEVTRIRRTCFSSSSSMLHHAGELGDLRLALRLAGLEQLDHAREAVRDVLAGDAAGVERPHGELGARLADRLGGDDADRLADVDQPAGGERAAVARRADADLGLAGEDRANADLSTPESTTDAGQLVASSSVAARRDLLAVDLDVLGQDAAEQRRVDVCAASTVVPSGLTTFTTAGMQRSVPQSSSRTMTSWATSTSRRVR